MVQVARSIRIEAPVERVFAFLDVPDTQVRVTPSLTAVRNVDSLPDGGKRLGFTYRVAGVPVTGTLETTVYEPPNRITFAFVEGLLTGRIEWTLEPQADGAVTRFVYRAEYGFRVPLVGRVAAPLVRRLQERELTAALKATKRLVERGEDEGGGETDAEATTDSTGEETGDDATAGA
jgi:uncharacterized protein YndB with AHSA1/START domain